MLGQLATSPLPRPHGPPHSALGTAAEWPSAAAVRGRTLGGSSAAPASSVWRSGACSGSWQSAIRTAPVATRRTSASPGPLADARGAAAGADIGFVAGAVRARRRRRVASVRAERPVVTYCRHVDRQSGRGAGDCRARVRALVMRPARAVTLILSPRLSPWSDVRPCSDSKQVRLASAEDGGGDGTAVATSGSGAARRPAGEARTRPQAVRAAAEARTRRQVAAPAPTREAATPIQAETPWTPSCQTRMPRPRRVAASRDRRAAPHRAAGAKRATAALRAVEKPQPYALRARRSARMGSTFRPARRGGGTWGSAVQCAEPQACGGPVGTASCQGSCAPGQTQCGSGGVQACNSSGGWGAATACTGYTSCQGGACSATCSGTGSCSGGGCCTSSTCQAGTIATACGSSCNYNCTSNSAGHALCRRLVGLQRPRRLPERHGPQHVDPPVHGQLLRGPRVLGRVLRRDELPNRDLEHRGKRQLVLFPVHGLQHVSVTVLFDGVQRVGHMRGGGGCCQGGTRQAGTVATSCGSSCTNCTVSSAGHLCQSNGTCGCNTWQDCPQNLACNTTTHQCTSSCVGVTVLCNRGCCNAGTCG